jgi:hypothetical protein
MSENPKASIPLVADVLRERFEWRKVELPKVWRPEPGEELVGYFGNRTLRDGPHGQYEVVVVYIPKVGARMVSGTEAIQLVDSAMIKRGHPIRLKFLGREDIGNGRFKKKFSLMVAEGEPLFENELAAIEALFR